MTDKTARNDSDKRPKGSIVERVAKRVSSDLLVDIAKEHTPPPGNGGTETPETPARVIRGPAVAVEEEMRDELFPDIGSADVPRVTAPSLDPTPGPKSELPSGGQPADNLDPRGKGNGADPVGAKFDIDLPSLAAAGYISPNEARSRKTEQYRLIKRSILNRKNTAANPSSNLILVTSALPDEGKTYTAINLAISMAAEENMSVLLIDADFNKRGAVKALGCPKKIGLIDVLENPEIDFADVMTKTNISNLTFVPAGQAHRRSTELLASPRMAQLATEISSRYENRLTIFDCPPLLMTTETAALTAHVGQILFVIRAEKTKEAVVRHALELIDEKPEVGLVLNRTHTRLGSSELGNNDYYYYGYDHR